jgi:acetyltransferase-like isoleucine patch superfamily enzyme
VIRKIIFRVVNRLSKWLYPPLLLKADPSARVNISSKGTHLKGEIFIGKNAELTIGEEVQFQGILHIGDGCKVFIGSHCEFSNVTFQLVGQSEMNLAPFCIFDAPVHFPNKVRLEGSKLELKEHVCIQAEILVRFGGLLTIGAWSSVNYLSEIRCEERVTLGEYCMISYEVCIFDTNTHSVNWKERRERIPFRGSEVKKPDTKPVSIGDDVWIGKGATILKGTTIGSKSIVGIRTLVTSGDYPEESRILSLKPVTLK